MSRDLNVDKIKKLWILDLIIQCGSLKKAALEAKVSPSAISQALSSLEQSVGRPLLIREKGVVIPTPEAHAILNVIRPAFEAFDRLRELNHAPIPKLTWLNFGTYESIAVDILHGLIYSLKQKMPHLRLSLRVARTGSLLTMVRRGELSSALITEVEGLERMSAKEVAIDRLGLFVSKRMPIAKAGWRALEEYGLGSLAPGRDGLPRYFSKFMKQLDLVRPFILSDSFETLRAATVAGALVAVLPNRVAMRDDELIEISPSKSKRFLETGKHKIYLVSQTRTDPEETDFLAAEASRLLNRR